MQWLDDEDSEGTTHATSRMTDLQLQSEISRWCNRSRWYNSDDSIKKQSGNSCLNHSMTNYFGPQNNIVQWGNTKNLGGIIKKLARVAAKEGKVLKTFQQHCETLKDCVDWLHHNHHTRTLLYVKVAGSPKTRSGNIQGNHFLVIKITEDGNAFVLDSHNNLEQKDRSLNVDSVPPDRYDLEFGFHCTTFQFCGNQGKPMVLELSD